MSNESRRETSTMHKPPIVSAQEWETAYQEMLVKEKEHMRAGDALAAQRRRMPSTPVEKDYVFDGPDGKVSLLDLFAGRRQLILYERSYNPMSTAGPNTPAWVAR